jgi:cytochrome P450
MGARMVLDQAQRLYPPAWAFARVAQADDKLGHYRIPADAMATVCQALAQV